MQKGIIVFGGSEKMMKKIFIFCIIILLTGAAFSMDLKFKDEMFKKLIKEVPKLIEDFDTTTGHFGKGIWIVNDQHPMYPLALVYSTEYEGNKYYKDPQILEIIMKAGDALIEDMDKNYQWEFRKKDSSTWGPIYMPWTYSRWIRAYTLIKEFMPKDRKEKWDKIFLKAFEKIKNKELKDTLNIPAHHAMGLYIAGKTFNKPKWCEAAADNLHRVIDTQNEAGYWSEGVGPVVMYNFVYIDAIGTYYSISKDHKAYESLKRAALFHYFCTYPDGSNIETVDQRNPYSKAVAQGNIGFTLTPMGRKYLKRQWDKGAFEKIGSDNITSFYLYGEEGEIEYTDGDADYISDVNILREKNIPKAATIQKGKWFFALSAYTSPVYENRWWQDRQNFVSVYNESIGVFIGGGNTKLQPLWSNFTVGDKSFLKHKAGDTNPKFNPTGELYHVPTTVSLVLDAKCGIDMNYGRELCKIRLNPISDNILEYTVESTNNTGLQVEAHITLLPFVNKELETGAGEKYKIKTDEFDLSGKEVKGFIKYAGIKISVPDSASVKWPVLPHNPYTKDGFAKKEEGRIVISIPIKKDSSEQKINFEILK